MNVLVLGGTVFLGRHLVAALVARGHRVTTFNRGNHIVDAELPVTRIDGAFLAANGCTGWNDLPLWPPPDSPYPGLLAVDVTRAVDAGLTRRPLDDTVRDTRDWFAESGRDHMLSGLDPARETELLERWNAAISS